ncbi:Hypothetical predicted protein, partial [Lynx pardinus]
CGCFPQPLTSKDCSFAALTRSATLPEGLTEHRRMSNGRMPAAPRNTCRTLLLPVPGDGGQEPARPRKTSCHSVAAAFQGLWEITTHIWHQASALRTLFQYQRMLVAVFWDLLGPGAFNRLYQMSFQQWSRFSLCGLRTSRTPLCSWGFTLPTRAPP